MILIASTQLLAQKFNRQRMDSLFTLIESNEKGMGSISVFDDGNEVYQNTFGYASTEDSLRATAATKYRIGSISKIFTAIIIMGLVEDNQLHLDTKLATFYPQIENAPEITIEDMLRHRSGIYNYTSAQDYRQWMEQPITKEELVKKIAAYGSSFKPGKKVAYSNANYVLLSLIAEHLKKKEFGELVREIICEPCGLHHTFYGGAIAVENDEAKSYIKWGRYWQASTETDTSVLLGAGAMTSNPTDLNLFLNCLFNHTLISEESLNSMMNIEDNFGIGMLSLPYYDKSGYGHTGGIDGFQSIAAYYPAERVSVSYTSNGVVTPINDILMGTLNLYFGTDDSLPEFEETLQFTSEELKQYLGVYSDPDFPLEITITQERDVLVAQATGQSSFALEAYEPNIFNFEPASLELEFIPEDDKMILRQGGGEHILTRR